MGPVLWLCAAALAGSLDIVEVGGSAGSPGAANATSAWWNPAGLAVAGGSSVLVAGAPTLASVRFDRTNPDYGEPVDLDGDGVPDPYDYGGLDRVGFFGVLPFVGAHTDLGVNGLGLGAAVAVPYGRGAKEADPPGSGSFHLREGALASTHLILAGGYRFGDTLAVGVSGALIESTWSATVDAETLSVVQANAGGLVDYADPAIEYRPYVSTLTFDGLRDHAFTFGAGATWTPSEAVAVSLAYVHGAALAHTGPVRLQTSCPPESDVIGRAAFQGLGLCDADVQGEGGVAYRLPARLHGSVVIRPGDRWRIEPMAGWVGWSVFDAYDIDAVIPPEALTEALNPEEASKRLEQHRLWARGSHDGYWVGVDGRGRATEALELGARVLYDAPAIDLEAISTNNFDTHMVGITGSAWLGPFGPLTIGLSAEPWILAPRIVEDSVFAVTLAEERNPVETFYPSSAGEYRGNIWTFGLSVELATPR